DKLSQRGISDLRFRKAQIKVDGQWTHGTIEDFTEYYARVVLPEYGRTEEIKTSDIVPYLNKMELNTISRSINNRFSLDTKLKSLSLASVANASKQRLEKINQTALYVTKEIFPISYNGFTAYMRGLPTALHQYTDEAKPFTVVHALKEPGVRFGES